MKLGNKGQILSTFNALLVWLVLSVVILTIGLNLLDNYISPIYSLIPFGDIGVLLFQLVLTVFWGLLGINIISRGFSGQETRL